MIIQQLKDWLKRVWCWLAEGKLIFMCLLVIAAAIILGFITWSSEVSIRSAGFLLQLIGMIFTIRGLLGIRAYFGQPLLRYLFFDWLKRFPSWKRKEVNVAGTVQTGMVGLKTRIEVWAPDDPRLPIEERIIRIINSLNSLNSLNSVRIEQSTHAKLINDLKDSHEEHKKTTLEQKIKIEENFRTELESLHTSDLITSLVGLVWFG